MDYIWFLIDGVQFHGRFHNTLRIQAHPKEGITPRIILWSWDCNHQFYFKE